MAVTTVHDGDNNNIPPLDNLPDDSISIRISTQKPTQTKTHSDTTFITTNIDIDIDIDTGDQRRSSQPITYSHTTGPYPSPSPEDDMYNMTAIRIVSSTTDDSNTNKKIRRQRQQQRHANTKDQAQREEKRVRTTTLVVVAASVVALVFAVATFVLQYRGNVLNSVLFREQVWKDCRDREDMKTLEACRNLPDTPFDTWQPRGVDVKWHAHDEL